MDYEVIETLISETSKNCIKSDDELRAILCDMILDLLAERIDFLSCLFEQLPWWDIISKHYLRGKLSEVGEMSCLISDAFNKLHQVLKR